MNSSHASKSAEKFCLITGAASGLGLEFAKIFAANGYSLVLIDKDGENLLIVSENLRVYFNVTLISLEEDLSNSESASRIYSSLNEMNVEPEILVNNAGFGYFGFFAENNWEKQEELIRLSVLTSTHLTRLFLPGMRSKKKGRILNVASLAAFQPGPLMSVYHASKAFILSFSLALSNELKGTGIHVTVLCPGVMATGFQKANNNESPKLKWTVGSAEKVAKYGYKAMMKNKVVVIPGLMNKIAAEITRLLPGRLNALIVRKFQEKNRMDFRLNSINS